MKTLSLASVLLLLMVSPALHAKPGTSEDSSKFASFLQRNPGADADGDGVLTVTEWGRFIRAERNLPEPAVADFSYGDHPMQSFDLWLPEDVRQPVPLVLFIHGGGFSGGTKADIGVGTIENWTKRLGFACASISYRLAPEISYPATHLDCARALQTLRHHAREWNIDPQRVASTGSSAGAGISMWLAFHDDLADNSSRDPIARGSTRLICAAVSNGQSSYDPRYTESIGLPGIEKHGFFFQFYGIQKDEFDSAKAHKLYEEAAAITHLTKDDVPVWMTYGLRNDPVTPESTVNFIVHHPRFGIELQKRMEELGIECVVSWVDQEDAPEESQFEFLERHLKK